MRAPDNRHCAKTQYRLFYAASHRLGEPIIGEMAEWSKAHAWKVCIRQRIEGSNPSLSATQVIDFKCEINFSKKKMAIIGG